MGGVEGRRLTGALLAEQLDERLVLAACSVPLDRVLYVGRALEQREQLLVAAVAHGAQQHRHGELALAGDAHVHGALLVDLKLEPGAALRHEVGDENLLLTLGLLGFHDVGARRAHELCDHHTLGTVDDEGAPVGHHGEVTHEHRLLANLARLLVDEAHDHGERRGEGHVFVAALIDRLGGLAEGIVAELHEELVRVVADR